MRFLFQMWVNMNTYRAITVILSKKLPLEKTEKKGQFLRPPEHTLNWHIRKDHLVLTSGTETVLQKYGLRTEYPSR